MFIDKGNYLELEEFLAYGIKVTYSTVKSGDFKDSESVKKSIADLDIEDKQIYTGEQTHSSNIVKIDENTEYITKNTDGFITNREEDVILTRYADCLPIYFLDKKSKAFGCVHSGWKGSFDKIALKAIEMLEKEYTVDKKNLLVAFGIGISQKQYEVGEEFLEKFKNKFNEKELENVFLFLEDKIYFDNQQLNYNLLIKKGISEENIIRNKMCTFEDKRFHSYRRDKENSGRNGSFIFKINKNK